VTVAGGEGDRPAMTSHTSKHNEKVLNELLATVRMGSCFQAASFPSLLCYDGLAKLRLSGED
jgi:hypothetical protein